MKKLSFFLCSFFVLTSARAQLVLNETLTAQPGSILTLQDADYINNSGSNQNDGTVYFTGSQNNVISAGATTIFNRIVLNKTAGSKLTLNFEIRANDRVQFINGLLDLNGHDLQLPSPAFLENESENSRIIGPRGGYVIAQENMNAPAAYNMANLGAVITSSQNLGYVTIFRGHRSQTNSSGFGSSITRSYIIDPQNNTGLNATLRFNYFDAELNSLDENTLVFWKSTNGISWSNQGFTSGNTVSNYVQKTGINDFSYWTLSSPLNALPLVWGSISANCENGNAVIRFQTLQEYDTKQFVIQSTENNRSWKDIGIIQAAGNSSSPRNYSFTTPQSYERMLYRIKQEDINGKATYSAILNNTCGVAEKEIKMFPNPVQSNAWVSIPSANAGKIVVKVYDQRGSFIGQQTYTTQAGNNIIQLQMTSMPSGSYLLHIIKENKTEKVIPFEKM